MSSNDVAWPSFENFSLSYAERMMKRHKMVEAVASVIQNWWRSGKKSKNEDHTLVTIGRKTVSVRTLCRWAKGDLKEVNLDQEVLALEKMDGTNVGVRDDGRRYGRKTQLSADAVTYQKVPLENLPSGLVVNAVKERLEEMLGLKLPCLVLYGELMCQPQKHHYVARGYKNAWLCFGGVIKGMAGGRDRLVSSQLRKLGFWVGSAKDDDADEEEDEDEENGGEKEVRISVTLRMCPVLRGILQDFDVPMVPLVAHDSMLNVLTKLQLKMMGKIENESWEGVVLVGRSFLVKWKTAIEDESKGAQFLKSICTSGASSYYPFMSKREIQVAELLYQVANRNEYGDGAAVEKPQKVQLYASNAMGKAIESALTKIDAVDVYFAKNERQFVIDFVVAEVVKDLEAETAEQKKCVESGVKQAIGKLYSKYISGTLKGDK